MSDQAVPSQSGRTLPIRKYPTTHVGVVLAEGVPVRSTHPHQLVTLDFAEGGKLLQVSVHGSDLRVLMDDDDPINIALLKGNPDLDRDEYIREWEECQR